MVFKTRTIDLLAHNLSIEGFPEVVAIEMNSPKGSALNDKEGVVAIGWAVQKCAMEAFAQYKDLVGDAKDVADDDETRAKVEAETAKLSQDELLARDVQQMKQTLKSGSTGQQAYEAALNVVQKHPTCLKFLDADGNEVKNILKNLPNLTDMYTYTFILAAYIDFLEKLSRQ